MRRTLRTAVVLAVVGAMLLPTGVAAQTASGDDAAFVVDVHADGSAEIRVRYTFDLTDDTRKAAFEELRTNETVTQRTVDTFRSRMRSVINETENLTGREMTVTDASIEFRTVDSTGVAELSVTVDGLVRVAGDRLVLTEPFASGFQPERTFSVLVPEGYTVDSVTPQPDSRNGSRLSWAAGTDLTGFELVASEAPTPTPTLTPTATATATATETASDGGAGDGTDTTAGDGGGETAGGSGPGFGPVAVVAATLLALAALLGRR